MAGRGAGPDFAEALARGLDILACFDARHPSMSLSEIAAVSGLARPTARRLLLTLDELGYVRSDNGSFGLTPKVLELGIAYAASLGLWGIARPHLEALVPPDGGVVVDGAAGRPGHRLRGAGVGAEDHRPPGGHRHPVSGAAVRLRARCSRLADLDRDGVLSTAGPAEPVGPAGGPRAAAGRARRWS